MSGADFCTEIGPVPVQEPGSLPDRQQKED